MHRGFLTKARPSQTMQPSQTPLRGDKQAERAGVAGADRQRGAKRGAERGGWAARAPEGEPRARRRGRGEGPRAARSNATRLPATAQPMTTPTGDGKLAASAAAGEREAEGCREDGADGAQRRSTARSTRVVAMFRERGRPPPAQEVRGLPLIEAANSGSGASCHERPAVGPRVVAGRSGGGDVLSSSRRPTGFIL